MSQTLILACSVALFGAFASAGPAFAQGNSAVTEEVKATDLSGVVTCCEAIALDNKVIHAATPLSGVAISECDKSYRECSATIQSDALGHFTFQSARPKKKVHYLKFVAKGFDVEHLKVTLRSGSDPLIVSLVVAT
jgi:hypothetical protein